MGKGRYPAVRPTESSPWINGDAQVLFNHYYNRLAGIACTRYRWVGLPDNVDPMRVETMLVLQGGLGAFLHLRVGVPLKDGKAEAEAGRFTVTRATYGGGQLDDLFNPAEYRPYGPGVQARNFTTNAPLKLWRGVPIWGDALRMNYDGQTIELWANRLARAALVVDTNMMATTRGVVIATEQDKLLTSQTVLETTMSGIPAFVSNKSFDIDSIKALDLGVHPEQVERSHVVAMRLWNESLTALGVQAGAQEKEERLTDDEVQAIRGAVESVRRRTLTPRQQAANLINRRYFEGAEIVKLVDQW